VGDGVISGVQVGERVMMGVQVGEAVGGGVKVLVGAAAVKVALTAVWTTNCTATWVAASLGVQVGSGVALGRGVWVATGVLVGAAAVRVASTAPAICSCSALEVANRLGVELGVGSTVGMDTVAVGVGDWLVRCCQIRRPVISAANATIKAAPAASTIRLMRMTIPPGGLGL
jgi:hypothetical protein